jgi:glycosidase
MVLDCLQKVIDQSQGPSRVRRAITDRIVEEDEECPVNATMFQGFEWYVPADHRHWKRLQSVMPQLNAIGIDQIWIPPGCKASWRGSNGYDIYDLYDLGEFDWKGLRATKWGTKEELVDMTNAASSCGIGILWDAVLNHKAGADYKESCHAVKVDPKGEKKDVASPALEMRSDCYRPAERDWQTKRNRVLDGVQLPRSRRKVQQYEIPLEPFQRHRS